MSSPLFRTGQVNASHNIGSESNNEVVEMMRRIPTRTSTVVSSPNTSVSASQSASMSQTAINPSNGVQPSTSERKPVRHGLLEPIAAASNSQLLERPSAVPLPPQNSNSNASSIPSVSNSGSSRGSSSGSNSRSNVVSNNVSSIGSNATQDFVVHRPSDPSVASSSAESVSVENNIGDVDAHMRAEEEGKRIEAEKYAKTPAMRKFVQSSNDNRKRNEEINKMVEIDVPTPGTNQFKTYQVPLDQLPKDLKMITGEKTISMGQMTIDGKQTGQSESDKLIRNKIDAIYETYITEQINKSIQSKDGKQYLRITYKGKDYFVQMQPMDKISDITKAIEKQDQKNNTDRRSALNKLSSIKPKSQDGGYTAKKSKKNNKTKKRVTRRSS